MDRKSGYFLLVFICFLATYVKGQTDCIVCDSRINSTCATLENISQFSSRCEFDNACLAFVVEGQHTKRGCHNENLDECSLTSLCMLCMGTNCNDRPYPTERLLCHQCVDCDSPAMGTVRPCEIYDEHDECFIAVEENEGRLVTYRGCVSDPTEYQSRKVCLQEGDRCVKCSGTECNNQPPTTTSTLSCVQCEPSDPECSDPVEGSSQLCTHQVPLGRQDLCYTYNLGDGNAQRGCLFDPSTPTVYRNQCTSNNRNCQTCSTPDCNAIHTLNTIECITCDESVDPDCRYLVNQHEAQLCPSGPLDATGCYRYESNNNVIRGCVSELVGTPRLEQCHVGEICKICQIDGCNAKVDFQECHNCNSGLSTACLRQQDELSPVRVCSDYLDTCVNIIQDLTRLTIRGCTLEVDALHTQLETFRQTCNQNHCNNNIYPIWRPNCHQCDDGEECNRDGREIDYFLRPCNIFWNTDQCYSFLRDRQAIRGCTHDGDDNAAFCLGSDQCEICTTAGCNFRPASRPAELTCVDCRDDTTCGWGFPEPQPHACTGDVWMGEREGCYLWMDPTGNFTRGCTLESGDCPEDHVCEHCYSSNCNNVAITRQNCIHCRSNADGEESCADEAQGINPRQCSGDFQSFSYRGCYTMRKPNNIVIRGCIRDLSADDFVKCQEEDSYLCNLCLDQNCNTERAPSTASVLTQLSVTLAISSLVISTFV
ncbi:proprotein convertase subtilisin/kexin type 5 [Sergentomyia squamirostris]